MVYGSAESVGIRLRAVHTDPELKTVRVKIKVEGKWLGSIYHALLPELKGNIRMKERMEIEAKEKSMSKARAFVNSNLTLIDVAYRCISIL